LLDRIEETVEIGEVGHIAWKRCAIAAELSRRGFQLALAPTRNEDIRTFRYEPFSRGESDTAASACN
jgi:hypothetical protein